MQINCESKLGIISEFVFGYFGNRDLKCEKKDKIKIK